MPFAERLRTDAGRRSLGLGLTLLIEALLILVLLTLSPRIEPEAEERRGAMTTIDVREAEQAPEPQRAEEEPRTEDRTETRQPQPEPPSPQQPAEPADRPATPVPQPPTPIVQMPWGLTPGDRRRPDRPAQPTRPMQGPPNNPGAMMRDTARVGTAPNGEPLYAAEWYREPEDAMMRAYLSGARGPGWGLIACRTAPDFRVEDCVGLDEYPNGSNIMRSALAAAWEFRVRPPRRGGQVLVGSWVRIRIDYR